MRKYFSSSLVGVLFAVFAQAFHSTWMAKTSPGSRECLASFSVGLSVALSTWTFFFLLSVVLAPTSGEFMQAAWIVAIVLALLTWLILLRIEEEGDVSAKELFGWAVLLSPVGLTLLTVKAIVKSFIYVVVFCIEFYSNLRPATSNHS